MERRVVTRLAASVRPCTLMTYRADDASANHHINLLKQNWRPHESSLARFEPRRARTQRIRRSDRNPSRVEREIRTGQANGHDSNGPNPLFGSLLSGELRFHPTNARRGSRPS